MESSDRAKLDWFKNVILPHEAALRARLRRSFSQPSDLDDCVAEILARVYASPGWHAVAHGRAHVFTVARNLLIDRARRARIVAFDTLTEADLLQHCHEPEPGLCARDTLRRVEAVLATLPPQARTAFVLRRIHEKPVAEIADMMGLSVSTVEKHLVRAVRLLMRGMSEGTVVEPAAGCGAQSGGACGDDGTQRDRGTRRALRGRTCPES